MSKNILRKIRMLQYVQLFWKTMRGKYSLNNIQELQITRQQIDN